MYIEIIKNHSSYSHQFMIIREAKLMALPHVCVELTMPVVPKSNWLLYWMYRSNIRLIISINKCCNVSHRAIPCSDSGSLIPSVDCCHSYSPPIMVRKQRPPSPFDCDDCRLDCVGRYQLAVRHCWHNERRGRPRPIKPDRPLHQIPCTRRVWAKFDGAPTSKGCCHGWGQDVLSSRRCERVE